MEVVLGMSSFILSDADIRVAEKKLVLRSYIMQRPCLLIAIKRVEFDDRCEFAAGATDKSFLSNNAFDPGFDSLRRLSCWLTPAWKVVL